MTRDDTLVAGEDELLMVYTVLLCHGELEKLPQVKVRPMPEKGKSLWSRLKNKIDKRWTEGFWLLLEVDWRSSRAEMLVL